MKFSTTSKIACAVLIAGVIATAATSYMALRTLKIGSPLYAQIILGKDLLADILPPPEYIIESYLEATLAFQDPATADARSKRIAVLKGEYDTRHAYWIPQEFDDAIRDTLIVGAHGPAVQFYDLAEKEFFPALAKGDMGAATVAYKGMSEAYAAHRAKIDEIVKSGTAFVAATEERSHEYNTFTMAAVFGISALMLSLVLGAAWVLIRGFAAPLTRISQGVRSLADGNFDIVLPGLGRKDEIGEIASAVEIFKSKAIDRAKADAELKQSESTRAATAHKQEMMRLGDQFQATAGTIVDKVLEASTRLEATAKELAGHSETTERLSGIVAAASEETSANVQGVASASQQLSSTVAQIGAQVQESTRMAQAAVEQASKTQECVAELSQSAERIGNVVDLIDTIASQTNLLALNATIEAARAGEAGKGFAVVAQEVKALASQTGQATSQIAAQITSMQGATSDAVAAIEGITSTIGKLSEYVGAIASAVEEQGATTREITRSVGEAAKGTAQVASSISEVNTGATETGAASGEVLSSAQSLSRDSSELKVEMEKFLSIVRSA
ncbi:methyl-accepting chemotaxis protein [Terrihabitans soli]|uniref:Methyl-accepting chemotaxis protein n=1 Tax=Terrihabitans soli TaxID=708113 RepID=A0A6S6QRL3_9HYPH|nr:HAMP domain-containing methyl-accepting chemotaxis protein [Terrihabitans soli]BCJ89912.1 methyl-accepting chemotaxis protein [Terrihabitans soli]